MIDSETKVHCLYGFPVNHSFSPIIFNRTFNKLNHNRAYLPFPVKAEYLKQGVEAARVLGFEGFNVTMPHKTRILHMLDRIDSTAQQAGSVNTVSRTRQGLIGHNTDGEGGIRAIKAHGMYPEGRSVLVLGAGGAARSIAQALARLANTIMILSRDANQARKIAELTQGKAKVSGETLTRTSFEKLVKISDLLVNATPVETSSLLRRLGTTTSTIPSGSWVFDLAYDHKPPEPLPVGLKRISALEMLVQQAALSYQIWMHQPAPFELMRSTLVDYLGADWK